MTRNEYERVADELKKRKACKQDIDFIITILESCFANFDREKFLKRVNWLEVVHELPSSSNDVIVP